VNTSRISPKPHRGRPAARRDLLVVSVAMGVLVLGAVVGVALSLDEHVDQIGQVASDAMMGALLIGAGVACVFALMRLRQSRVDASMRTETEARYQAVVEQVPAIVYTWDTTLPAGDAPPVYISPQLEAMLGYTPQEWADDPGMWLRSIHPDDRERVRRASDLADRTVTPFHEEYRIATKDGHTIWVRDESVVVARDPRGRALRAQGVIFDITEQREAQERLERAEERYRTLVETLPVVTYMADADGREGELLYYVAPSIEELTGYPVEGWMTERGFWESILHPDDRDHIVRLAETCSRTGDPFDVEYRMIRKDGSVVWVHDHAISVQRPEGGPVWQGVIQDVTERKEAERALAEADERYRNLVEQSPAITYIEDPRTGRDLYISPQVEAIFGYTPGEWAGNPDLWRERLHPDDRDHVLDVERAAVDRFDIDYRTYAHDGSMVWVHDEATLIRDERGTPLFWQGVIYDITERKEAEERLREAEERYRTLVEQLPAAVYVDADDSVATAHYVSPQYEQLTGYSPEVRLATPDLWVRMLHPLDRDRVIAESDRTNITGEPFEVEYRIVRADGEVRWLHDHAIEVIGPSGERSWQGVLSDITDRKLAEEALGRRDRILEAAGDAAERFLRSSTWRECIDDVLERLGRAGTATRAALFENVGTPEDLGVRLLHSWLADNAPPTIDRSPSPDPYPYGEDFSRWRTVLSDGGVIQGRADELPAAERRMIEEAGIQALVAVPVHVDGAWWGYISFDQCDHPREWQSAEVDAIRVVANTLGAAITRELGAQRLLDAQERYRTLIEQIPAITYMEDAATGDAIYTSPQVATLLGYDEDGWGTYEQWAAAIHPDDRERVVEEDRRTNATGDPFRYEYRLLAKDGRVVWVLDEAVLMRDELGVPRYWQGVRFDITARKEAEEQLRDAEQRYRGLIETIPAVTYIDTVDELSQAVYMSPQVEDIFGYTAEEWIADNSLWERGLHPDDREAVTELVTRLNEDGAPYHAEYRFVRPDGRIVWVSDHAVVLRDVEGRPRFSQGVFFDITARREAEEQLRDAEERYRAIVEHVPAAIYLDQADRSMRSVYVSPQIEDITGMTPAEWIEDPELWLKLVPAEDREAVSRSYMEAVAQERPWQAEYRLLTRDGRTIWVHDETTVLRDEQGDPTYLQGVLMDITERKLAEHALRESEQRERDAAERLRALDEMKNTFLAAVSHELRSPLTSILGLSLTLERSPEMVDHDRNDLLERLSSNARKLDRLLKDLLDIDRLNRGIVEPAYRTADVGALARRAVESLEALHTRTVVIDTQPLVLTVDPPKIERIVENLAMNAARHTDEDRTIWVKVRSHDGGALLSVEDDGPGVPLELREAIFEPFRQGPTASPHSPGTGIGLSLVTRFAQLHGGRAWVDEREGGGAAFRVFIPAGPGGTTRSEAAPEALGTPIETDEHMTAAEAG
jgi:PAS domain S-box-containing protein